MQTQPRKRGPRRKLGGRAAKQAVIADARDPSMYRRRCEGASLREIAEEFGVDVSTVSRACDRQREVMRESIEEHRDHQAGRVREIHAALMPEVRKGNTDAARTILQADKRLADLYGLDAAKKHEVTGADGTPLLTLEAARALIGSEKGGSDGKR